MRALNVATALWVWLAGCGYMLPAASREPPPEVDLPARILVGTARVDVTPPPGVSTFGHAADAEVTDGVWTRLYCRVFAFKTERNERIAIVPCDLAAVSTLLQRSVAERVRDVIPATRLMLTATHTHAGPAHYFDAEAFSNAFSSHMPGFDPKLVSLLADRIAAGVRQAFRATRPATLRFAHYEGGSDCAECGMWGITWNRSLAAHALDGETIAAPDGLRPVERAIDPALHVLRIDAIDASERPAGPIGVLAFFAMHPTVLPHENRLLGADTHGAISRVLEARLRAEGSSARLRAESGGVGDPLVGIVNTNEGDIAPKWFEGTKSEAIAVGTRVADRIAALLAQSSAQPKSIVTIGLRYREVDLPRARGHEGALGGDLCELPEPGESFAHGACDHPADFDSSLLLPGPPYGGRCQTPKRGLAGSLGALIAGGDEAFPHRVPLALLRLDDSLIAFVPAELTIGAGAQIKRALLAAQSAESDPNTHAIIAGLANGYILYVTTRAEFGYEGADGGCAVPTARVAVKRQSYEAGSTLYGPFTAAFLAEQFGLLSRSLRDPFDDELRALVPAIGEATAFRVTPGIERPRLARPSPEALREQPADADLCTLPHDGATPTSLSSAAVAATSVCFSFTAAAPGAAPSSPGPWLRLLRSDRSPTGIDDRGVDFVTRVLAVDGDRASWTAIVRPSDEEWSALGAGTCVMLEVGGRLRSQAFARGAWPPACSADQIARCGAFDEPRAKNRPFPGQALTTRDHDD